MSDCYLTLDQAEVYIGLSKTTLFRRCRDGQLGAKLAGRWIIKASELDAWYEQERPVAKPRVHDPMPRQRSSFRDKVEGRARRTA